MPTRLNKKQRELLESLAAESGESVSSAAAESWTGSRTRLADAGGPAAGSQPADDPGPPDDEGLSAGDTWIELSVRADLEAVEAVSEILSRLAPGGTSVEPGFELIDEGLGARIDPNQPAIVRAYLPGRDRTAARAAVRAGSHGRSATSRRSSCARSVSSRSSVVHEADWAHAWKAHFPVLRIGRRLVIQPTWRRHRRRPTTSSWPSIPGWPSGRACIRRPGCAWPASSAGPTQGWWMGPGPRRRLWLGHPR